jgi:hypothetical protein
VIVFLTKVLVSLTQFFSEKSLNPQKFPDEFDTYNCLSQFWVQGQVYFQLFAGIKPTFGGLY